jgi:SAM-dependent methyltransferase
MATIWDYRARLYDICEGSGLRRGPDKARLFRHMRGKVLFAAVGTGLDILHFPPGLDIVAIDISEGMLRRAAARAADYPGKLALVQSDAMKLGFPDASFDTVATSCTMCSVPDPVRALREMRRVLRPGGRLLMFEHVRSRNPAFGLALDLMTLWTRVTGTEMNRDTVANVTQAGFKITRVDSVWLDVILSIQGVRPAEVRRERAVAVSQTRVTRDRGAPRGADPTPAAAGRQPRRRVPDA